MEKTTTTATKRADKLDIFYRLRELDEMEKATTDPDELLWIGVQKTSLRRVLRTL